MRSGRLLFRESNDWGLTGGTFRPAHRRPVLALMNSLPFIFRWFYFVPSLSLIFFRLLPHGTPSHAAKKNNTQQEKKTMDPILRCPFPSIPSTPAAAVRGGDDAAAASARQGGLNPAAAELRETPDGVPWKAWIKEEHRQILPLAATLVVYLHRPSRTPLLSVRRAIPHPVVPRLCPNRRNRPRRRRRSRVLRAPALLPSRCPGDPWRPAACQPQRAEVASWIWPRLSDFVAAALRRGGRGSRRPMWVQWSRQQAHTTVVAHGAALVCDHMVAEEGRLPIALHAGRHLHRRLHQQDRRVVLFQEEYEKEINDTRSHELIFLNGALLG
ncbi:uncharacterized protein [Triticum aestivum]|uniref:uncharacterized protein isoform X2 n=1 Tax=Triticum aestivum TaxID=4565 RepID=UPI001D00F530|nr:uncharacterized protein LOC123162271 isoform X2 [Triticum aestivum]XP_044435996.1 uncharacterized protein LOC123162271 isoform X2 [Triticum aestivum]XP_044435997.1 uncharacterized protein LOC123162271 isoform X2 [Triticum aestivum]